MRDQYDLSSNPLWPRHTLGLRLFEDRSYLRREAWQEGIGGECLLDVEELWIGIGPEDFDGAEARVDDPNQRDADGEIIFDLLGDVFDGVRRRQNFDSQDWWAIDEGRFGGVVIGHVVIEIGDVDADCCQRITLETIEKQIVDEIVLPSLRGAKAEGFTFRGVLFIGLMLTKDGAKVLEYNVRLGDPETQAVLKRLDSDLLEILLATTEGRLHQIKPRWSDDSVACVVMASAGYPGSYENGKLISGIAEAETVNGVNVFQAGTCRNEKGEIETAGGRVLAVTARAATLAAATELAYAGIAKISFAGGHYRRDIGRKV